QSLRRRRAVRLADVCIVALDVRLGERHVPTERPSGVARPGDGARYAIVAAPLRDRDRPERGAEQLPPKHETGVTLVARGHVQVRRLDAERAGLLDDLQRAEQVR